MDKLENARAAIVHLVQSYICVLVRHPLEIYSPSLLFAYGRVCPYCGKRYK